MSFRSVVRALVCGVLTAAAPALAFDEQRLAAQGDRHFAQLAGFDAIEAYEVSKGSASASFVVMRRWSGSGAEVLIDVHEPASLERLAILITQNDDRSDDLFAYFPAWRRVLRLNARLAQAPIFDLISLADVRPIAPGELEYSRLDDEEVGGELCTVLEGRPTHRGLGFERVELALSRESGFSLRTRFFRSGREIRRVLIAPKDLRRYGDRLLPARRRILFDPEGEPLQVELRNIQTNPALPARLFSHHNLMTQRFPSF
jgi:hypothetical protein